MLLRQTWRMTSRKYHALDGLRGIAALAVMLYHMPQPFHRIAAGGYLAVDLFFLMSGFVVAAAYEQRLVEGWSVPRFMLVRLKRLWPLYALGVALGVACFEAVRVVQPQAHFAFPHMSLAQAVVLSLFFVPQLSAYGGPAFPFNSASWSLSVELFGNLGYGVFARFLHTRLLVLVTCLGMCGIIIVAVKSNGLDAGVSAGSVLPGYMRFLFSFPLGVLLFRWHAAEKLPALVLPAWVPLGVASVALVGFGQAGAIRDVLIVVVLFPAALLTSLSATAEVRSANIFTLAGAISYPLYILHPPLIQTLTVSMRGNVPLTALVTCGIAVVLLAAAVERWFDRPVQDWFKRGARVRAAVPAPLGN